jgi:polyribonucleotide nucleotidyltransferase
MVSSPSKEAADQAIAQIKAITAPITVGEVYTGQVTEIIRDRNRGNEIGAIIQITPKKEGMVHISELADYRVGKVTDIVKVGDTVKVKVVSIDPEKGRIALSKKQVG